MTEKKLFGRTYVPVKNAVILSYFGYDERGKVYFTMKLVGKLRNRREPVSPDNVEIYEKHGQFYLHADEPLMTIDGKQRKLPNAVLTCALADDPRELNDALEKLAGVLRHSKPFTDVYRKVR